jgi:hypothetical protein
MRSSASSSRRNRIRASWPESGTKWEGYAASATAARSSGLHRPRSHDDSPRALAPSPRHMPEGRHPVSDDQSVTGLVTRARNGDKQAWGALVERYGPADLVDLPPTPTGRRRPGFAFMRERQPRCAASEHVTPIETTWDSDDRATFGYGPGLGSGPSKLGARRWTIQTASQQPPLPNAANAVRVAHQAYIRQPSGWWRICLAAYVDARSCGHSADPLRGGRFLALMVPGHHR